MNKDRNEVVQELQMLTGISSKDVTVLYYNLIKDGTYFEKLTNNEQEFEASVKPFDEWFNNLEVVE